MTLDFSSAEKIEAFRREQAEVRHWPEPLPNLQWLTESEFAQSHFFMFSGGHPFTRSFGGPNAHDNLAQLPPDFVHPKHASYAKCFFDEGAVSGFVLLSEYHHDNTQHPTTGKVWFGKFAFCEHKKAEGKNLGRCYNQYTCSDCGYIWSVDSSD